MAILSDNALNGATDIDRTSLTFGHSGTEKSLSFCDPGGQILNGVPGLVCHFETSLTGFSWGDTVGILMGKTSEGIAIRGAEIIKIVP